MHRAFSFPVTVERSRTKERLEASLVGLCELELRKQRQECLVLGALALGDPPLWGGPGAEAACCGSWGQENLTLRRQLSALQSSPWGLMQALEQQVGELRVDDAEGCHGAPGETGCHECNEGTSARRRAHSAEPTEAGSSWTTTRPKSVGDPLDGEREVSVVHAPLPRSFSAPYPPLDNTTLDSWQWDQVWQQQQQQQPAEDLLAEEVYQQAMRVEGYIAGLLQRYTLASRAWQPRTTLSPDTPHAACGHNSTHGKTPVFFTEKLLLDPVLQAQDDLSTNPTRQKWGCDLLEEEEEEEEACGVEAPSLEDDSDLALPYPQSRSQSLTESLPSPLPSRDPNAGPEAFEPPSPQNCIHPQLRTRNPKHSLVGAPFIPGRAWLAPVHSPRPCDPTGSKSTPPATCADPTRPNSKPRGMKKNHNERQRAKKSSSKTSRSQSENSLLGQPVLPERRYSTTGRHQSNQVAGPQPADSGHGGSRRWCSNLELSQDEGESLTAHVHKRQPRRARSGHPSPHDRAPHCYQHQHQRLRPDVLERAPLCQEEDSYAATAPAESESSMSERYSPASSSLSSDSDESGGLVWPQQLPPRFASTSSSSSSPSPQAAAGAACQPKAFVKIKASHALKRKILRFRSGSLKVMTTV